MIVQSNFLEQRNTKTVFRDEYFDGVSAVISDQGVVQLFEYSAGVLIGPCAPSFFPKEIFEGRTDEVLQEDFDNDVLFLDSKPFDGLRYVFDGPFCTSIEHWQSGSIGSEVSYHQGELRKIDCIGPVYIQEYEWDESGQIARMTVSSGGKPDLYFSAAWDSIGLKHLGLSAGFFDRVAALNSLYFPELFSSEFVFARQCAGSVILSGLGIDGALIDQFLEQGMFVDTQSLCLERTGVVDGFFRRFSSVQLVLLGIVTDAKLTNQSLAELKSLEAETKVNFESLT